MQIDFYEELYRRGAVDARSLAELYRIAARERKAAALIGVTGHRTLSFASALWTGRDAAGRELWVRTAENLWTTIGATWLLNNALTSASEYLGIIAGATAPAFVIGDTMASHAGWSEVASADIVQTVRQTLTWGAASAGVVNNSGAQATYQMASAMVGTRTLWGGFMADSNTLGGTSGNLISEAAFDQGSATVAANNTITVLVTVTILAG